jgi:DNA transformation protein
MPKPIDTFHDYVVGDVLGHISDITSRKMFGGYGVYLDGVIFAIITADGELRFKANDETKEQYESLGGKQFIYTGHKKGPMPMPYWQVPAEIMEDRERIAEWAHEAAEISKQSKK